MECSAVISAVRRCLRADTLALALTAAACPALAQSPPSAEAPPAAPTTREVPPASPPEEATGQGIWERDHLLGDPGGVRSRLEKAGYTFGLQETSEVLGNANGGIKTGAVYEGATFMSLKIDTGAAFGLPGGTMWASAYQIHGRGLSANNLDNLNIVSSIEATRATRLFEWWYDQNLFDDLVSVRIGQMAADQEFIVSQYAGLFINSAFGWPTLAAEDLPSGGPAYPLSTPGVRLKVQPREELAVLLAVLNGNPAPAGVGNPQLLNHSGTSFVLDEGVFVIGEVQYAIHGEGKAEGLPGTYKLGAWYNSNQFPDQRYANDGLLLANPASNGIPLGHLNNWSMYAVADQLVWRVKGTKDQGIGLFGRVMAASNDRNLVNVFLNVGATWKGVIPGRDGDTLGLGIAYTRIGARARRYDTDVAYYTDNPLYPQRTSETALELTYQAPVTPWLTLQPDFQYVFNPSGGILNPNNPTKSIGGAAVFGLRSVVVF